MPGGLTAENHLTDVLEIYDPAEDAWSAGPPLPTPLCAYAIAATDDALYLFGGWDGQRYLDTVLRFDVAEGRWEPVATMHAPAGFGAALTVGERIYLTGGFDGEHTFASCESFSPARAFADEDPWLTHSPMREARAGHGMALVGDGLYVIGGGWDDDISYNERYNIANDAWSTFPSPITGQWRTPGAAAIAAQNGDFVITVGGWQGQYLGVVRAYQATFRVFLP